MHHNFMHIPGYFSVEILCKNQQMSSFYLEIMRQMGLKYILLLNVHKCSHFQSIYLLTLYVSFSMSDMPRNMVGNHIPNVNFKRFLVPRS